MKFKSMLDKKQFILETTENESSGVDIYLSLKEADNKDWVPSEEIVELFLKRRKELVGKLKNFRKSQVTKGQWRKNRYKMMKGIKSFHKSTKGKQFHRSMSRFLINRRDSFLKNPFLSNEALKALSSLETHLYIENDYYLPSVLDNVDRDLLLEELIPTINRVKQAIFKEKSISNSDNEFLLRVIDQNFLITAIATKYSVPIVEVENKMGLLKEELKESHLNEDEDGYYSTLISKLVDFFSEV